MQYRQNLTYKPTADNKDNVAPVTLDGAIDLQWTISPVGSVDGQPVNVEPGFVAINNINGKKPVTISYGPYVQICPAYQTQVYTLPKPAGNVVFLLGAATEAPQVYFDETGKFVSTIQNLLAIQQAARGVSLYPFVTYTAALSPQLTSDANETVQFVGVAVNIIYSLLPVAATPIENGWFQFIINNGTRPVALTPFGGDTINAIFNNATPFNLYPGEYGVLTSDGAQWFVKVMGQKRPTITYTAFSTTQQPNDLFKRLVFSSGFGQSYNLLTSTTFSNGDRVTAKNGGTGVLAIVPNGGENINGEFTAAAPLYLYPRDEIDLYISDAGTWAADGVISWKSPALSFNAAVSGNALHNMGGTPSDLKAWVLCTGAEINYTPGDFFQLGLGTASSTNPGGEHVVVPTPTSAFWTMAANAGIRLPNKTTGVSSNIASAGAPSYLVNFALFFTATRRL
jgi:hypothetical protein